MTAESPPVPLPRQVRPRAGETTDSLICRLARANHLRPSYLYGYLCGPPQYFGRPRLERLAAVTGRTPDLLRRTLSDAAPTQPASRPTPSRSRQPRDKAKLFRSIRKDAEAEGLSSRALAGRYHVGRRTVHAALTHATPPPRKALPPRGSMIDPVGQVVESLAAGGLTIKAIWNALLDDHDAEITYTALRYYLYARGLRSPDDD